MDKGAGNALITQQEVVKYVKAGMSHAFTYQLFYFIPLMLFKSRTALGIKYLLLRIAALLAF